MVKRIMSQIVNFEEEYNIFCDGFIFHGKHIKYFLDRESLSALDCLEVF